MTDAPLPPLPDVRSWNLSADQLCDLVQHLLEAEAAKALADNVLLTVLLTNPDVPKATRAAAKQWSDAKNGIQGVSDRMFMRAMDRCLAAEPPPAGKSH